MNTNTMNIETVVAIISAVVALASLVVSFYIYKITGRKKEHQYLMERVALYYSPEMFMAIQRLWKFYGANKDNFLDKYIEIKQADEEKMDSLPYNEQLNFLKTTLHSHRRLVSQFWRGMAILLKCDLLPKEVVFTFFSQDEVEIVEKIIVPIENKLAGAIGVSTLVEETDPFYFLISIKPNFYKAPKPKVPEPEPSDPEK